MATLREVEQPNPPASGDQRPPLVLRCAGATADWIVKPVVHAVVALAALGVLSPSIVVGISRVNPTCASHPGFVPVNMAAMLTAEQPQAEVTPLPPEDDPDSPRDGRRLFDRRLTTTWVWPVPGTEDAETDELLASAATEEGAGIATLQVTADLRNVQLICVVNGNPVDPASYVRANRAEVVEVRTDCSPRPSTVTLRSQSESELYSAQPLPLRCRDFTSFTLTVRSAYPGQWIEEPEDGERVGPTNRGAIAELIFYRPVGAGHADYSRTAAAINWMYVHPGTTALWLGAFLLVLVVAFGVGELLELRRARQRRAAQLADGTGPADPSS